MLSSFLVHFSFVKKKAKGEETAQKREGLCKREIQIRFRMDGGMRFLKIAYTFPGILFLAIQKQIGKMRKGKAQTEDGNGVRK